MLPVFCCLAVLLPVFVETMREALYRTWKGGSVHIAALGAMRTRRVAFFEQNAEDDHGGHAHGRFLDIESEPPRFLKLCLLFNRVVW